MLDFDMELHHKQGRKVDNPDKYANLALVTYEVHKLIHATNGDTIAKYLGTVGLDKDGIKKLNKFRKDIGNSEISID